MIIPGARSNFLYKDGFVVHGPGMLDQYRALVHAKTIAARAVGFEPGALHASLFPFQRDLVRWACRRGRAALFEECGLGKTRQQLAWADQVAQHTHQSVLILAPLAVAEQTVREAQAMGLDLVHVREIADIDGSRCRLVITNYERAERFLSMVWGGLVLDESSIIKSHDGHYRRMLTDAAQRIPYRLACSATPAPNDHMELGTHAEFLGVMSRVEMLASFFVHDGGDTSEWRLKGHAVRDFWRWVASWAAMLRKPSDLGYDDADFALPALTIHEHVIPSGIVAEGTLFALPVSGLTEERGVRRATMAARVAAVAALANTGRAQWLVWCDMNDEGDGLTDAIRGAVQVAGSDSEEDKVTRMMGFTDRTHRVLVTKGKIGGWGMNWQHCQHMAFVGATHSFETFYQCIRRCWRFGQKKPVHVHMILTDLDGNIADNLKRKQAAADAMAGEMLKHMSEITKQEIHGTVRQVDAHTTSQAEGKTWRMIQGDCVESMAGVASDSIGYSIFSPPFASLYTYSNSPYDMGNCGNTADFIAQFRFLVAELLRVTMPGRLLSFHCMNLPLSKERDGVIGIRDFRGELIAAFVAAGWVFHSEVCIWKDPVTAMQRTKALGLLHKQIRKDSCMSRQGIPDYLVTMRKPGENPDRVSHTHETFPVERWQQYASPVWMDINPSDTLQRNSAREEADERHICPLQLEVIERALLLWTKEDDLVLSPFAGIGSEGYVALKHRRRFLGMELKASYYRQACANLRAVEVDESGQARLDFGALEASA